MCSLKRNLLLLLLLNLHFLYGQNINYASADSLSFQAYQAGEYGKVIQIGKAALAEKIDFYYLRTRMAIAYYQLQNYEAAIPHFEKAQEMYPTDLVISKYLYYAYLLAGRKNEAASLAERLSSDFQARVGYKREKGYALLESGIGFTKNIWEHENQSLHSPNSNRGQTKYTGGLFYGKVVGGLEVNPKMSVDIGVAGFRTQSLSIVQPPNRVFKDSSSFMQWQYNLALNYRLSKSLTMTAAGGFFKMHSDTLYLIPNQLPTPPTPIVEKFSISAYCAIAQLTKRMKYWQPSLSFAYANLSLNGLVQTELGATYYPFGNTKLYGNSSFAYRVSGGTGSWVASQKIGGSLTKSLYYELNASYGEHQNYLTSAGFSAFNTADPIRFIGGANLHIYHKNWEIIPAWRTQQCSNTIYYYRSATDYTASSYSYLRHFATLSVKCSF